MRISIDSKQGQGKEPPGRFHSCLIVASANILLLNPNWEGPHAEMFLNVPIVKEKVIKFSQVSAPLAFAVCRILHHSVGGHLSIYSYPMYFY